MLKMNYTGGAFTFIFLFVLKNLMCYVLAANKSDNMS